MVDKAGLSDERQALTISQLPQQKQCTRDAPAISTALGKHLTLQVVCAITDPWDLSRKGLGMCKTQAPKNALSFLALFTLHRVLFLFFFDLLELLWQMSAVSQQLHFAMMPCCTVHAYSLGFKISAYGKGHSLWLIQALNFFITCWCCIGFAAVWLGMSTSVHSSTCPVSIC